MSERIEITLDPEPLKRALEGINQDIDETRENASDMVEDVEAKTTQSFNEVMGYMRTTYLMISGVSRILGGGMTQIFSSMYMTGMSAIGFYKSLIPATLALPGGQAQAAIMAISVITATTSLISIMAGQRELSTKIRGMNMALHGISGMISSFSL